MKERWYSDQRASVWMRWTRRSVQLLSDDARWREENAGDAEGPFEPILSHATLCSVRLETLKVSDAYGALWMRGDEVFRRTNSDSGAQLAFVP